MVIAGIPTDQLLHTREIGREEGEAQGEVQGEARGRALGEVAVTLRLLNRRCGPGSTSHG